MWNLLNDYLIEQIEQAMGQKSDYTSLKLNEVDVAELGNFMDSTKWNYPVAVVMNNDVLLSPGPFGDGKIHYAETYDPYVALMADGATRKEAGRSARVLFDRFIDLIPAIDLTPLLTDGGTQANDMRPLRAWLGYHRRVGGKGRWAAYVLAHIRVETES